MQVGLESASYSSANSLAAEPTKRLSYEEAVWEQMLERPAASGLE